VHEVLAVGNRAALVFPSPMSVEARTNIPIPGVTLHVTPRGFLHVRVEHFADPAKATPEWLEWARTTVPTDKDHRREHLLDWHTSSGDAFFPEFSEIGRARYVYDPERLLAGPVYRGWDFGVRGPVCVWLQYSHKSDRVYVLREFAPGGYGKNANISAHHFRDICRWASGQLVLDQLYGIGHEWAELLLRLDGPKPPWFPPYTVFEDFSGAEVHNRQSIAARDPVEATLLGVWEAGGITISPQIGPVKAREVVMRRLLPIRPDGYPGILVAGCCTEVLAMLDGGLVYKQPTRLNPRPTNPKKDGRFDNVMDAIGYALVAVVSTDPPVAFVPGQEDIGWTL